MRKATLTSKPKKAVKKTVKKVTKKSAKKKTATKKTRAPKYIQPEPARTKDVPVPFKDTEDIPHYLLKNLVDI